MVLWLWLLLIVSYFWFVGWIGCLWVLGLVVCLLVVVVYLFSMCFLGLLGFFVSCLIIVACAYYGFARVCLILILCWYLCSVCVWCLVVVLLLFVFASLGLGLLLGRVLCLGWVLLWIVLFGCLLFVAWWFDLGVLFMALVFVLGRDRLTFGFVELFGFGWLCFDCQLVFAFGLFIVWLLLFGVVTFNWFDFQFVVYWLIWVVLLRFCLCLWFRGCVVICILLVSCVLDCLSLLICFILFVVWLSVLCFVFGCLRWFILYILLEWDVWFYGWLLAWILFAFACLRLFVGLDVWYLVWV